MIAEYKDSSSLDIMAIPFRSEILEYYSRPDILDEMMKISRDREFCGAMKDGSYQKRPNMIQFPGDIIQMVRSGVTSFHCSVERWKNPMQLSIAEKNYAILRKGFDFLIDIDSKIGETREETIRSSQLCASLVCDFFRSYGIKNHGIKFSGSRGFHIIIPWEAFPKDVNGASLSEDYPRAPQVLAGYVRHCLREKIMETLVDNFTAKKIFASAENASMDPYSLVEIEKGWGERHLFRAPYSLNEKTWFVSLPLKSPGDFSLEKVTMKNARITEPFVKPCEENEAKALLRDALNWDAKNSKPAKPRKAEIYEFHEKVLEEHFPPCIKTILGGLGDGKKRSIFTLINFLKCMNWPMEEIDTRISEWNLKNPKPLPSSIIMGQVNYAYHKAKSPPANCSNDLYYKSIGICKPDDTCSKIKNPASYPFKKPGTNLSNKPAGKYICRECKRSFRDSKSLVKHQKLSHKESVE